MRWPAELFSLGAGRPPRHGQPTAALRTHGWERQQTQLQWQPGRPPAAQKTPARAQWQQAQRLWQRQPHHPTISFGGARMPCGPTAVHRPASPSVASVVFGSPTARSHAGQLAKPPAPLRTARTVSQQRIGKRRTALNPRQERDFGDELRRPCPDKPARAGVRLRPAPPRPPLPPQRRPTMLSRQGSPVRLRPLTGSPNPRGRRSRPVRALWTRGG